MRGRHHMPGFQQLREREKREKKLKDIRKQVAQGTLVIRKMTGEERRRYPRPDAAATRRGSKRRP